MSLLLRLRDGLLTLSAMLAACGPAFEGREVFLGAAGPLDTDLSSCAGGACIPQPLEAKALAEEAAPPCSMHRGAELETVWSQPFYDDSFQPIVFDSCGELGDCELLAADSGSITSTSDGSVWFAFLAVPRGASQTSQSTTSQGWLLMHHAPDGTLLHRFTGEAVHIEPGDLLEHTLSLVPGDDGGVVLAVAQRLGREGLSRVQLSRTVQSFGRDARPLGPKLIVSGDYPGSSGVFAIGSATATSMTLLNGTRVAQFERERRRWVAALPEPALDIVAAADDAVTTLSQVDSLSENYSVVQHFDASGRLVWRRSTMMLRDEPRLAVAPGGDVFRSGGFLRPSPFAPIQPEFEENRTHLLHRISPTGESRWVVTLRPLTQGYSSGGRGVAPVIRSDGHIWMAGPAYFESLEADMPETGDDGRLIYYDVAPDATSCTSHHVNRAVFASDMALAPDDDLYVLTGEALARLRRP